MASPRTIWYDNLHVFRRHRRFVVTLLTATLVLAVLQTRASVPQYRAKATLLIGNERENFVGLMGRHPASDYYRDPELYAETQYRMLSSVTLGDRVAERLDLAESIPDSANPLSMPALWDRGITGVTAGVRHAAAWLRGSSVTAVEPEPESSGKATAYKVWARHIADSVVVLPETDTRLVRVMFASPAGPRCLGRECARRRGCRHISRATTRKYRADGGLDSGRARHAKGHPRAKRRRAHRVSRVGGRLVVGREQ